MMNAIDYCSLVSWDRPAARDSGTRSHCAGQRRAKSTPSANFRRKFGFERRSAKVSLSAFARKTLKLPVARLFKKPVECAGDGIVAYTPIELSPPVHLLR